MKKKTKRHIVYVTLFLLVLFSLILIWQLGFLGMSIEVMGSGSVSFIDDHTALVTASSSECLGNPRGNVEICFEHNQADKISDWVKIEGTDTFSYDGREGGCSFYTHGDTVCLKTGFIGDGVFCSWDAEVTIHDPTITTTTTTIPQDHFEEKIVLGAIPVLILLLVVLLVHFKFIKI